MPIVSALIFLIQIGFAVHVVRTGRPFFWLWLIIFVPVLGCLVYAIAELVPGMGGSRTARRVTSAVDRALYSERDFKRLTATTEEMPTADNLRMLAEELLLRKDAEGAKELYEKALAPPHDTDPTLLMGLARCRFLLGDPTGALEALDFLQESNPGFQSHEGHLFYARSLEEAGRTEEALEEYAALAPLYPGQEAKARYAMLLEKAGRDAEAAELYRNIVKTVERGDRHYRRAQREWNDVARNRLAGPQNPA